MEVILSNSEKKDKRFKVKINNKTIHFGLKNPKWGTYIDHLNPILKENYIKRHIVNEDWTDLTKAGTWARYILWNETSINKSIKDMEKRFKIKIVNQL